MQKLKLIFLFIVVFIPEKVTAQRFASIKDGCWLDETIWDRGSVPGFSDTIIIKSRVLFSLELNLESGAYLEIDSNGLLCVTNTFNLPCGAFFYNYGTLRVQSFEMLGDGGNYGLIVFSNKYRIKPCTFIYHDDSVHGYGGALDSCDFVIDTKKCYYKTDFKIYPNPIIDELKFEFGLNDDRYLVAQLYDIRGRKILDILNDTVKPGEHVIDLSSKINSLAKGIYVFRYIDGSLFYNKKLLKL